PPASPDAAVSRRYVAPQAPGAVRRPALPRRALERRLPRDRAPGRRPLGVDPLRAFWRAAYLRCQPHGSGGFLGIVGHTFLADPVRLGPECEGPSRVGTRLLAPTSGGPI